MKKRKTYTADSEEEFSNVDEAAQVARPVDARAPKLGKFLPADPPNDAEVPDFTLPGPVVPDLDTIRTRSLSEQANVSRLPLPFLAISPDTNDVSSVSNGSIPREVIIFGHGLDVQPCPRCLVGKAFSWEDVADSLSGIVDET